LITAGMAVDRLGAMFFRERLLTIEEGTNGLTTRLI
jgi:hypothetical protein